MINDIINRIKKNKIFTLILVLIIIMCSVMIYLFARDVKVAEEDKNITRLTEEFEKNQTNKTNGLKGADFIVRNEEGEVIEEKLGTYDIPKIDSLDETTSKKEGEDFAIFFSEKINENNYEELYNLLNQEYKDDFDVTKDMFEFNYTFNTEISAEVTNVETNKEKDRLIVTTKLIEKDGAFRVVDFTIYEDGTYVDMPIFLTSELPYETEIDNVTYKINKRYDTRLGAIYNIEIDNNSDRLIKISDMLIQNKSVIYSYEVVSDNTILESYPGIPFSFKLMLYNNSDIDYFELQCEDIEGKPYSIIILDKNN